MAAKLGPGERVEKVLLSIGPCLSGDLGKAVSNEYGITELTARKWIERAKKIGKISTLNELRFIHNQQFFFLERHRREDGFQKRLCEVLKIASSQYRLVLGALLGRGGTVPFKHFGGITGLPAEGNGKNWHDCLLLLWNTKVLHKDITCDEVRLTAPLPVKWGSEAASKTRMALENSLLDSFGRWSGRLNFISPGTIKVRTNEGQPEFNGFGFDLVATSYLSSLRRVHNSGQILPGFVVMDVVLGIEQELVHVEYFFEKCARLSKRQPSAFIGILLADGFTPEAFYEGRKRGLILATPENLFGKQFGLLLNELKAAILAVYNDEEAVTEKLESVLTLETKLNKAYGEIHNLRGRSFEFFVAYCGTLVERKAAYIRKVVKVIDTELRKAEIDVAFLEPQRRVWCIECKGHGPDKYCSLDEVQKWISTKVPIIRSSLNQNPDYSNVNHEYSFWTSGKFTPECVLYLEDLAKKTKRFRISWKDGEAIKTFLGEHNVSHLKSYLKDRLVDE